MKLLSEEEFLDRAKELGNIYGQTVVEHLFKKRLKKSPPFPHAKLKQIEDQINLCFEFAERVKVAVYENTSVDVAVKYISDIAKIEKKRKVELAAVIEKEKRKPSPEVAESLREKFKKVFPGIIVKIDDLQWRTLMEANVNMLEIKEMLSQFEDCDWLKLETKVEDTGNFSVGIFVDDKDYYGKTGIIKEEII